MLIKKILSILQLLKCQGKSNRMLYNILKHYGSQVLNSKQKPKKESQKKIQLFFLIVKTRRKTPYGLCAQSLSRVQFFATPWTVAHQAPLSRGFSRQEYQSGFPCPLPGDLPNPGIEPRSPTLQVDSLSTEPQGKPKDSMKELKREKAQTGR